MTPTTDTGQALLPPEPAIRLTRRYMQEELEERAYAEGIPFDPPEID